MKLLERYRQLRIRRACASFRAEAAFWGFDLGHLTDEELLERVQLFGERWAKAGISARRAAENLATAFNKAGKP